MTTSAVSPTMPRRTTPHSAWLTLRRVITLGRLPNGDLVLTSLLRGWTTTTSTRLYDLRAGISTDISPEEATGRTTLRCRGRQHSKEGVKTPLKPPCSHPVPHFSPSNHLSLRRYGNLRSSCKYLPNYKNLEKQYRRVQRERTRASRILALRRHISCFKNAKWRHKNIPKIGIVISCGEYRTMQCGASVLPRLDARNNSAQQGDIGGPLQIASYLLNLLGDSRLTGSLYANNSLIPIDLVYENGDDTINWLLDPDPITPDDDNTLSDQNQQSYENTLWSVIARSDMSIDTSPTNPWARMTPCRFSNHTDRKNFVTNDSAHNADQLWSRVSMIPSWSQHRTL
ncbi:hypothetical protein EDB87DRAFT_1622818, partial [Lactarius vividus]